MRLMRDRAIVVLFVLALALPGVALLGSGFRDMTRFENRAAAPWPHPVLLARIDGEFRRRFESAFQDRFGGRDALVHLHHLVKVAVFGVSPVRKVIIGRDRWLYFLGEDGTEFDRHHRGIPPYADAEIAAVAAELERRHAFLAARGIAYVVAVVPDKHTIYPEHLPGWVARAPRTPLDRVTDALLKGGVLRLADLRGPLLAAKARYMVYLAGDTHWNIAGAVAGYVEIMRQADGALAALRPGVRLQMASLPPLSYIPGPAEWTGDLARMIGLPERYKEPYYAPLWRALGGPGARWARHIGGDIYACANPGLPRAVVYLDSMGTALVPLLAENFSRTVFVSSRRLDAVLIERERPDIVIEQLVERALFRLAEEPMSAAR